VLEQALVERPGDERDRAVAARGRVAGVVEEDDAEVAAGLRVDDEAAVHVGVAAWLVDQELADVVEAFHRIASRFQDRSSPGHLHPAGDDPKGLAAGVVVDGVDQEGLSGKWTRARRPEPVRGQALTRR
jgi:hypothetical protein